MAKVSVIIPCFNQGRFLAEAVQSVLDQGVPDVEIVVVNDGSSDNTREVARRFGDRILYIEQQNSGVSSARNRGIRSSSGEFVAFLDGDDVLMPGSLAARAAFLDGHREWSLVSGDAVLFDENGQRERWTERIGRPSNCEDFRWEFFCPPSCTVMVRRSALDECGLFEEGIGNAEDWNLWLRIGLAGRKAFRDEPLALHRRHGANVTNDEARVHARNREMMRSMTRAPYFLRFPPEFRSAVFRFLARSTWRRNPVRAMAYLAKALVACPAAARRTLGMFPRMAARKVRPTTGRHRRLKPGVRGGTAP